MSTPTLFQGEVQFAGYSDSHTQGPKVAFRLQDSGDLDAFRALTVAKGNQSGQRMALVLVLVGDDEQPEAPPAPTTRHPVLAENGKIKPGPLCMEAIQLCQHPAFRDWVQQQPGFDSAPVDEAAAKEFILYECGIHSRKELDTDRQAALRFIDRVRVPFMGWARMRHNGSGPNEVRAVTLRGSRREAA
jgi:hypothetical protein